MVSLKKFIFYIKQILLILFIYFGVLILNSSAEKHKIVKVGILLGFTGPVESLTPDMANSAELAFKEVLNDKSLKNEIIFKIQKADSTCVNIKLAKNAVIKIVSEGVTEIIGAACPNISEEIAKEISIPKKILMISPADTSNELINLDDKGFFFRTTPSKIRGSRILADITKDKGIKSVAISFSAEEEYKKYAESYSKFLNENNIKTTIIIPHNKNINDYSKHISALTAAGGDALAVISDINFGGNQIIKSMIDIGMFKRFILPDNMIDQEILNNFKNENLKKSFGYLQGLSTIGGDKFINLAKQAAINPSSPYTAESYDAAAIIILSKYLKLYSKKNSVKDNVYLIANKPGVKIYPGEISKAIKFLKEGKSINYEGATGVEFDEIGDTFGSFIEVELKNGEIKNKKYR